MPGAPPVPRWRRLARALSFLSIVGYDLSIDPRAARKRRLSPANAPDNDHLRAVDNRHYGTNATNPTADVRIAFRLHDPRSHPLLNLFAPAGRQECTLGALPSESTLPAGGHRGGALPPALSMGGSDGGGGRVLDVTTSISTDLKILHMGDSVTVQLAQAFDEMLGAHDFHSRQELWEAYPGNEGGTLAHPVRGGGMHGTWRITSLLSQSRQGWASTKNKPGGGWNYDKVWPFLAKMPMEEMRAKGLTGEDLKEEKVDAVVFRVMHGWMPVEEITRARVVEAAEMAHRLFRADTYIFQTAPFTNNVMNNTVYAAVARVNDMIRDVARTWHETHDTTFLVMELANYYNHIIWTNARHIGYDVSAPLGADPRVFDEEGPTFLQERLNQSTWPPSIPMVCARKPPPESYGAYCDRNYLFKDGMHVCTQTLAARIGAGTACLLGCSYNRDVTSGSVPNEKGRDAAPSRVANLRSCERRCNEQFLSVMPLRESWINKEGAAATTLASFPG